MRCIRWMLPLLLVSSFTEAAKRKKAEPSAAESLDVELPSEWNTHTKVDPLAPRPDAVPHVEAWIGIFNSRDLTADPGNEPRYTSGWLKNAGLMYLFKPELASWPAWLGVRVGATFGWMERTRSVTVINAEYGNDQKAYLIGVPLGLEGEFFFANPWSASAAVEVGPQWAFRSAGDTAGGGERILGWSVALRPMLEYRFTDSGIASVLGGVRVARDFWPEHSSSGWSLELGARF